MLTIARISYGDCEDSRTPVTYKAFSSSIKDWLTAYSFGTSAVDLCTMLVIHLMFQATKRLTNSSFRRMVQ